ncbi:MAG: hypothetical protein ABSG89_11275 [Bacteroidales bacterium]
MNKKKANIVIIALFHLLVFTFPFTIKAVHHHESHYLPAIYQAYDGKLLLKAEKSCPICQFEFFSFIADDSPAYRISQPLCRVQNYNLVRQAYKTTRASYLLRAPPLA